MVRLYVGHNRDPAKAAGVIEMPFGFVSGVGQRNSLSDGGSDSLWDEVFSGGVLPID